MNPITEAVQFCFPNSGSSDPSEEVLALHETRRAPDAWVEEDDLAKGTVKISLLGMIRGYAPDWILVVLLW